MQRDLTSRELAVLVSIAAGETTQQTADRLGCGTATVLTHRRHACFKLGARTIPQAIALAYDQGLLGTNLRQPALIGEGQLRAFHAKAGDIEQRFGLARGTIKPKALDAASGHFDREIRSANDLSSREASWVLDWLDERLTLHAVPA